MRTRRLIIHMFVILTSVATFARATETHEMLGLFNLKKDLFLYHLDLKTDVDGVHAIASAATMLADPRFAKVNHHIVGYTYDLQKGLHVPSNEVFERAFGDNWSDNHEHPEEALARTSALVIETLQLGGNVWIGEGGMSKFTADLIRNTKEALPGINLRKRVQVIQHSIANINHTNKKDLRYIRKEVRFVKIEDGNFVGNGTPGFRSNEMPQWEDYITDPDLRAIWNLAIAVANQYNGAEGRWVNEEIQMGGMDFSDIVTATHVFGFNDALTDLDSFFREFSTAR